MIQEGVWENAAFMSIVSVAFFISLYRGLFAYAICLLAIFIMGYIATFMDGFFESQSESEHKRIRALPAPATPIRALPLPLPVPAPAAAPAPVPGPHRPQSLRSLSDQHWAAYKLEKLMMRRHPDRDWQSDWQTAASSHSDHP